jgi:hypothetical protein
VTATELEHAVAGLDIELLDRSPLALRCPAHRVLPGDRIRPSIACSCRRPEGEPCSGVALITRPAATGRVTAPPAQHKPLPPLEALAA